MADEVLQQGEDELHPEVETAKQTADAALCGFRMLGMDGEGQADGPVGRLHPEDADHDQGAYAGEHEEGPAAVGGRAFDQEVGAEGLVAEQQEHAKEGGGE